VKRIVDIDPSWGRHIVRVSTGVIFVVHGVQKFAGGLSGVTAFFAKIGIPAPGVMGPFVATLELVGGVLLIVGLATRWISLLFVIEMLVTTLWVQIPTPWMERERSGSGPAGVEPTPRACRQWEGEPRRDLARERRTVRADRQVS